MRQAWMLGIRIFNLYIIEREKFFKGGLEG